MTGIAIRDSTAVDVVRNRFDRSIDATTRFFEDNADAVSATAAAMASRFHLGGRLIVFGAGAASSDAQHVAVEFIHPVIVGKRALPAIALNSDIASVTASSVGGGFRSMIDTLARHDDIALAILRDTEEQEVIEALAFAGSRKLLTVAVGPERTGAQRTEAADHNHRLPSGDPLVAQEVGETLYHVLWELVHLFLEHRQSESGAGAR